VHDRSYLVTAKKTKQSIEKPLTGSVKRTPYLPYVEFQAICREDAVRYPIRTLLAWLGRSALLGLACTVLLVSCGGGGGGSTPPALLPPANFTASQSGDFDTVAFSWSPASGGITGYEAEGRMGSGAWDALGVPIPPDAIGGFITFQSSVPELSPFTFHIRSVRGSERSAWSPDATYFRSLRPPQALASAQDTDPEHISLTWTRGSTVNTGTRVERALRDAGGVPGAYTLVADLAADATSYLDLATAEASSYLYRLRHATSTVLGMESTTTSPVTALHTPTDFRTQGGVSSVSLQWTNRSTATTSIVVFRVDGGIAPTPSPTAVAVLGPGATSYLDTALGAGSYTYTLELRSASQARQTPSLPGFSLPAIGWTGSQVYLPNYVRTMGRDGRWYGWENGYGTLQTTLYQSSGNGWVTHAFPLGTWGLLDPGVLVDDLDRPHAAYTWRDPAQPSGPLELRHAWHDGTSWQEETVTTRAAVNFSSGRAPRLGVAGNGTPHLLWSSSDASNLEIFEHAVKEGPAWTIQTLTSSTWSSPQYVGAMAFQVAPDGTAYLALGLPSNHVSTGQLLLQRRPSGGSWSEETVPAPGIQPGPGDPLVLMATSATQVDLLFNVWEWPETSATPWHITTLRKSGATWGTPTVIFQLPTSGSPPQLTAALNAAGNRMAVPEWRSNLHLFDPVLGTWGTVTFPASYGFGPIWFDSAGHLHVLTQQSYGISNPVPYSHFSDGP
jgi:hypothetical protein